MVIHTLTLLMLIVIHSSCQTCPGGSKQMMDVLENTKDDLSKLQTYIQKEVKKITDGLTSTEKNLIGKDWQKYGNHCYHFELTPTDWYRAEKACRELGGYLVAIDNADENKWLKTKISKLPRGPHFWIGLTDLTEGKHRWIYSQTEPVYTNFAPNEPDNRENNEDCVCLHINTGMWFDAGCDGTRRYICERRHCDIR